MGPRSGRSSAVVIDRGRRATAAVEIVGHYNPRLKPGKRDRPRADRPLGRGGYSDTVRTLLKRHAWAGGRD
jgi:ribosomal protein S16